MLPPIAGEPASGRGSTPLRIIRRGEIVELRIDGIHIVGRTGGAVFNHHGDPYDRLAGFLVNLSSDYFAALGICDIGKPQIRLI